MKKSIIVSSLFLSLMFPLSTFAQTPSVTVNPSGERGRGVIRQDIKNDRLDIKKDVTELKNKLMGSVARITNGVVTANNSTTLTVTENGKTYTVNVTTNTKLRRHFWGKSEVSEIAVNDKVNIIGKFTDDTKTTINAIFVRDLSIMKRRGVFIGTIDSMNGNTFVLKSVNRGNQTVTTGTSTKFVNRKQQTMTSSDLKVGDRVRVRGMWDKANSTITEVTEVKDFSNPVQPTHAPEPTEK